MKRKVEIELSEQLIEDMKPFLAECGLSLEQYIATTVTQGFEIFQLMAKMGQVESDG